MVKMIILYNGNIETKPELLSQCNIPKPLHGLNPRNIMGKEKWDVFRKKVYASTGFHCKACGVQKQNAKKHKWLEAHEDFEIDYEKQTMTLRGVVPLCHYCHQFIHSGFLFKSFESGETNKDHIVSVLKHGFSILFENNLPAFQGTINTGDYLGLSASKHIKPTCAPETIKWNGWKMVWDGVSYCQKFKTYQDWSNHYG